MFERFTTRARAVVVLAQEEARETRAARISPQHLLLALLQDTESVAVQVLHDLGASPDQLRESLGGRRLTTAGLDESEVEALRSIGIDAEEVVAADGGEGGGEVGAGLAAPAVAAVGLPERGEVGGDVAGGAVVAVREPRDGECD